MTDLTPGTLLRGAGMTNCQRTGYTHDDVVESGVARLPRPGDLFLLGDGVYRAKTQFRNTPYEIYTVINDEV